MLKVKGLGCGSSDKGLARGPEFNLWYQKKKDKIFRKLFIPFMTEAANLQTDFNK
jgi:hypothetical protein